MMKNLNKVVDLALKNNNDLKLAFIHMEQAAAQLGIDFSSLLPNLMVAQAKSCKNSYKCSKQSNWGSKLR